MTVDINEYDYNLPPELIAAYPARPRGSSRLLVVDRSHQHLEHRRFPDLINYLRSGDLLVLNDSRVFPARLRGHKENENVAVEVFLLRCLAKNLWEALVRPGRKLKPGSVVVFADGRLRAVIKERTAVGGRVVQFSADGDLMDLIWCYGEVPLPPYIKRQPEPSDREDYQTIYARHIGAVAAPTAGFHFSQEILYQIRGAGIEMVFITLHPGLGTFRPITVRDATQHRMETEFYSLPEDAAAAINRAKAQGRRVVAVGTTTVRALESAFDPATGQVRACAHGETDLFIYPPYQFQVIDCLLTNFHLPKSTLLLLVSALAGRELILSAYREAVELRYRFYSYGDAMLII